MAADHDAQAGDPRIQIELLYVMHYEDFYPADLADGGLRKFPRPGASIVIPTDGDHFGDRSQGPDHFRLSDIARMDDQIGAFERAERLRPHQTVRIGDDTD